MGSAIATEPVGAAGAARGEHGVGEAVGAALDGVGGRASLVIAFATGLDAEAGALAASTAARRVPVAGMTGSGAIGRDGAFEAGCAALAFGPEVQVGVGSARGAAGRLRTAARHAAGDALANVDPSHGHPLVLLFLDTRAGDQAEAIGGAYEAAGPRIPLAGGAAGGARGAPFAGRHTLEAGLVAIALVSPRPIGLGVANACQPFGIPSIVTRSHERMVLELDGRPAVPAYLDGLGHSGSDLSDSEFQSIASTHPLAQPELNGTRRFRHITGREGDALICATAIPPNAAIEYTREAPGDIVATAGEAVHRALARMGPAPASCALVFDCAGRKQAIGGSLDAEMSTLLGGFGEASPELAGAFTHGEVARVRGAKGDQNHAIVVVAFA